MNIDNILQEIGNEPLLSKQEEKELINRVHNNDGTALEQLVRANMRFVVSLAAQYQDKGLSLDELINAGRVGLANAAEKYEPTEDTPFISFATPIVRQSILASLEYNREKDLKEQFNQFFAQLGIEDLYSKLSNEQLIDLKKLLSCINNMITLRATDSFVLKLYQDGFIDSKEKVGIGKIVDKQHANANGYDVKYVGNKKIIAEVKCNIPVNETSFGAAQERGIIKDIEHLLDGKKKKQPIKDIADYYKFMVILDCEHAQESMEKIIKKREDVKLYTSPAELDKENVYVIYV